MEKQDIYFEDENSDENSSENGDESYKFKAQLCTRLSKELGLEDIQFQNADWDPPKTHGLSNSDVIIPVYYHLHKHPSKILKIDYYEIIKDDIRNFRSLNEYQMDYIKDLSSEYKNELLDIFNDCVKKFNELLNS